MKNQFFALPLCLFLFSCQTNSESVSSIDLTESVFNLNMIHYLGRNHIDDSGVKFAMTCSGFEIKVNVTENTNSIVANLESYADPTGGSVQLIAFHNCR